MLRVSSTLDPGGVAFPLIVLYTSNPLAAVLRYPGIVVQLDRGLGIGKDSSWGPSLGPWPQESLPHPQAVSIKAFVGSLLLHAGAL